MSHLLRNQRLPQDIGSLSKHSQYHVQVEWKNAKKGGLIEKVFKHEDITKLLRTNPAARAVGPPAGSELLDGSKFIGTVTYSS
jgi:hypothetical protein